MSAKRAPGAFSTTSAASGVDAGSSPGPLVSAAWLQAHLDDPDLRIVHVSAEPEHYTESHIPGAVFSDLHADLAVAGKEAACGAARLEYLLPTRREVSRVLQRWGAHTGERLVLYDDIGLNRHAIRGLWLLRLYGWPRDRVQVLDGGLPAWRHAGGRVTTDVPAPRAVDPIELHGGEASILATREQVAAWSRESRDGGPVRILDVRTPAEYTGEDARTRRGGHIPGAMNLDWEVFLTEDGRLRSPGEVRAIADAATGGDASTIRAVHCQGGVRAAAAWFVLHELAGLEKVRNYARSWEEWGNREDTPIIGAATTPAP